MDNDSFEKSWVFYNEAKSKGLEPLEEYTNGTTAMDFSCMKCGDVVHIQPRGIKVKKEYGCRACAQKKKEEDFLNEMLTINSDIEIIGSYINNKTKIECRCKICGYEWLRKPNDLLSGHYQCPKCIGYNRMTNEEFQKELEKLNLSFDVISEYINRRTPVVCKCKIDEYEWEAYPYDILNERCGCARCVNREQYTTERFKEIMSQINPDIEIIGEYIDSKTSITCKCKICGLIWNADPSNLKNSYTGCPSCRNSKSKGELFVKEFLDNNNILYTPYKRFNDLVGVGGKPLSYDFYLPLHKKVIECQGLQHYKPVEFFGGEQQFKIQQEHDNRKRIYAQKNGYDYIEIPYYDLKNINTTLQKKLL